MVIIPADYDNSKEVALELSVKTFESKEALVEHFRGRMIGDSGEVINIQELQDFVHLCNEQEIDLENSFIACVNICPPANLRVVNEQLYEALITLGEGCKEQTGGTIDYPSKDYGWIMDDLDLLAVKYFGCKPDGDKQEEYANDGTSPLTDAQAYQLLRTRFDNTRINHEG